MVSTTLNLPRCLGFTTFLPLSSFPIAPLFWALRSLRPQFLLKPSLLLSLPLLCSPLGSPGAPPHPSPAHPQHNWDSISFYKINPILSFLCSELIGSKGPPPAPSLPLHSPVPRATPGALLLLRLLLAFTSPCIWNAPPWAALHPTFRAPLLGTSS